MNNSLYSVNGLVELKNKKVTKEETKLALLVPNMFNKVSSGYYKKTSTLVSQNEEIVNTENKEISPVVNNIVSEVSTTTPQINSEEIKTKIEDNQVVEAIKEKKYTDKASNLDVIFLRNTKIRSTEPAKKLLISTAFIQKLISHRKSAVELNSNKTEEVVSKNISLQGDKTPIVSTEVVTKVENNVNQDMNSKDDAVAKYVELMNKRKEAIALKQQYEKEMTELVNKFNITLDMVNAELAKRGAQEVA